MKHIAKTLMGAMTAVAAWLTARLGGMDRALEMMFLLMALDVATGVMAAAVGLKGQRLLSRRMFEGITRKLMMVALVMLAHALDTMLGADGVSRAAVIGFYAANEGLSIVENAALLGVPFPKAVRGALEKLRPGSEREPDGQS